MDDIKIKASEYAELVNVSLNTVKNRIRAGVIRGGKEEDGVWYVYLQRDEYEHLLKQKEAQQGVDLQLKENLEKLKTGLEGSLIATYIELQVLKDLQKEKLLHELSSVQTLLAVKEKEVELLQMELQRLKDLLKEREAEISELKERLKTLEKEVRRLENLLREKDTEMLQKELQFQKILLEKDKEIMQKDLVIEKLKGNL
ncbi:hypothetical protein [Thermocrinis minervae]|uniref:Uncharacterized protein n=1 Tax=Thermocrinis minervae TaxID=381751 RepID=A0A1M6SH14_9AQUI|nr:hypothetical protein [Thermocrinis minervae]SHK43867.1 hypothetical protein SAMN05444391_1022 [Thermocrinis minervae]